MLKTIFVKIPSLDDNELVPTLKDCLDKAEHPERVHIAVSLIYSDKKHLEDLVKFKEAYSEANLQIVTREYEVNHIGVGKQRKIVGDMYDGQDYVLQVDSHTWFCKNWDTKLIDLHDGDDKTILTAYAGQYGYVNGTRQPIGDGKLRFPTIVEGDKQFASFTDAWKDEPVYNDDREFIPVDKFCANFAFGTKHWGIQTGLVSESVFWSEEPLQTEYLKINKYNFLYPNIDEPLICHLYAQHITEDSKRTPYTNYLTIEEHEFLDNYDAEVYHGHMDRIKNYTHIQETRG